MDATKRPARDGASSTGPLAAIAKRSTRGDDRVATWLPDPVAALGSTTSTISASTVAAAVETARRTRNMRVITVTRNVGCSSALTSQINHSASPALVTGRVLHTQRCSSRSHGCAQRPTETRSTVLFRFSVGTTTAKQSIQFRLRCHAELSKIDGTFPLCHVEGDVADSKKECDHGLRTGVLLIAKTANLSDRSRDWSGSRFCPSRPEVRGVNHA